MRWLRNQVIAPLTEELVFRACMLPMLAPCTGLGPAVFTCPLFFGVGESSPSSNDVPGMRAKNGALGEGELGRKPEAYDVVFTFLPAHFHHIIEQLRFRQSSVGSIFLSAGEAWRAVQRQSGVGSYDVPHRHATERVGD